jgi:hypothetical protein
MIVMLNRWHVDQAYLSDERGGEKERCRVDKVGGPDPEGPRNKSADCRPDGEHDGPCGGRDGVGSSHGTGLNDVRQDGGPSREVEGADSRLKGGERVEQPDHAGLADCEKPQNGDSSDEVGPEEDPFAVEAVGDDACPRAGQKRREHPHDEESAYGEARFGQFCDECRGSD